MMTEQEIAELLDEIYNRPEGTRVQQILEGLAWATLDGATDAFEVQLAGISRKIVNECRKNPGTSVLDQMHLAGELMGLAKFIHCKRSRELVSWPKNPLDRFRLADEKHP